MDFRRRQQQPYTPLMISGTPVERVSSFKYLGVIISENLTWTTHIERQVNRARQRLYHLRQLRKFRVSPAILKTFYSGTVESVLTQGISVWYGNSSKKTAKHFKELCVQLSASQGLLSPPYRTSILNAVRIELLKSVLDYRFVICKDLNHPDNYLFTLLPSRKRFRSLMAKTERLRRSFFPQAIRLLNSNPVLHIT